MGKFTTSGFILIMTRAAAKIYMIHNMFPSFFSSVAARVPSNFARLSGFVGCSSQHK